MTINLLQGIINKKIDEEYMIRAVIIDDEEKGRKLLINLLENYCDDIEIIATAGSAREGIAVINKNNPDIVFLDIVMPGGDGFSVLDNVEKIDFEVIFTTAYDHYAIKALRFSALDYLLKPINIDELQQAVKKMTTKIHEKKFNRSINNRLEVFLKNRALESDQKKIGLTTQNGILFVFIRDIILCKAEGNYTVFYFTDSRSKELVSKTLKEFDELLSEFNFFRIHRSYLVNLKHIKEYCRNSHDCEVEGDGGYVVLDENIQVPVSRDKKKLLLERFSQPF